MGEEYQTKLKPYAEAYKAGVDSLLLDNPYGVPMREGGWGGNPQIMEWGATNYYLHKFYPEIMDKEDVFRGMYYIFGTHPHSNLSFVSGVGTRSKKVGYGNNRADYSFIAGGPVPGVIILEPDYPENKENWPFFWGENEYVIDTSAIYLFIANAVDELAEELE